MNATRRTRQAVIALTALMLFAPAAQTAEPSTPQTPETGPAKAAPAQPAPNAGEPRLVCEQVQQMGSHFRRKVCATPEAWEARRRKDAAQMEKMGDQGSGCGGVANPC
jgi:hypothetical protein